MKYHVVLGHSWGPSTFFGLDENEFNRIIDFYNNGGDSFYLQGKRHDFSDIKEIQVYQTKKFDRSEFDSHVKNNRLETKGLLGYSLSAETVDELFQKGKVTSEYIKGSFGYKKEPKEPESVINSSPDLYPAELFKDTRTFLEKLSNQILSSYKAGIFDGCAVLSRKLVEILIIECFEKHGVESEIKGDNGNYLYLSDLISKFLTSSKWILSRNTKDALPKIKALGDQSAHNRRFLARKNDIDQMKNNLRIVLEELIEIVQYK